MAKCPESGECFAKLKSTNHQPGCSLLNNTDFNKGNGHDGHCPFQKQRAGVTNGRYYPYVDPGLR